MKFAHNITITVFVNAEDVIDTVRSAFKNLFPFDFVVEKILFKEETATGLNEQPIRIFSVFLQKERHIAKFIDFLKSRLSTEQKSLLSAQKESRLDDGLFFFIRFDKDKWVNKRLFVLTDGGNCVHIKIAVAAFPAKRVIALGLVEKLFA